MGFHLLSKDSGNSSVSVLAPQPAAPWPRPNMKWTISMFLDSLLLSKNTRTIEPSSDSQFIFLVHGSEVTKTNVRDRSLSKKHTYLHRACKAGLQHDTHCILSCRSMSVRHIGHVGWRFCQAFMHPAQNECWHCGQSYLCALRTSVQIEHVSPSRSSICVQVRLDTKVCMTPIELKLALPSSIANFAYRRVPPLSEIL